MMSARRGALVWPAVLHGGVLVLFPGLERFGLPLIVTLELFHRLTEADSAAARTLVRDLGLLEAASFRNVAFASHAAALAAHGGATTPALWDGTRLHQGLAAVRAALEALAARAGGPR